MQEQQESTDRFDSTCNLISYETLSRADITQSLKPSGGLQHASVGPLPPYRINKKLWLPPVLSSQLVIFEGDELACGESRLAFLVSTYLV